MAKVKKFGVIEILVIVFFITYLSLPIIGVLIFSFEDKWEVGSIFPSSLTLKWYIKAFTHRDILLAMYRSMVASSVSILIGLLIVLPTAYVVKQYLKSIEPIVRFLTLFPYVLPGVTLALGLIEIYSKPPLSIAGTLYLLIFSYVSISLPLLYYTISNSMQAIDVKTLTEASQSLGAGIRDTFFRVILPNVAPGITSASLLTFSGLLGEYTLVNLLLGARFKTLQIYLYRAINAEDIGANMGSVLTILYFIMVTIASFIVIKIVHRALGESEISIMR